LLLHDDRGRGHELSTVIMNSVELYHIGERAFSAKLFRLTSNMPTYVTCLELFQTALASSNSSASTPRNNHHAASSALDSLEGRRAPPHLVSDHNLESIPNICALTTYLSLLSNLFSSLLFSSWNWRRLDDDEADAI
jgi:hypothetical protein